MSYGVQIGFDEFLSRMREFKSAMGDDFLPAALLEKQVADGRKFSDIKA